MTPSSSPQSDSPLRSLDGWLLRTFDSLVLGHPLISLVFALLLSGFFLLQLPNFKLDASSESLVLENDDDLAYFREIADAYAAAEFLIITWAPNEPLLSDASLKGLAGLKRDLLTLDWVESVTSVLDVPLLESPRVTFSELKNGTRSLNGIRTLDVSATLDEDKKQLAVYIVNRSENDASDVANGPLLPEGRRRKSTS